MSERTRRLLSWSLTGLLAVALAAFIAFAPDQGEDRAQVLGERIRCPVCAGESIADSPSDTARAMMDLVRARISEGRSDQEIIAELVSAYSGSVLLDPPASGATLWLWLAPAAALVAGGWLVTSRFRPRPAPSLTDRTSKADKVSAQASPTSRSSRVALGGLLMIAAAAVTLGIVGQFRQARPEDPGTLNPDSISNETLEAVIAANLDDPAIVGMRLALANRYFEAGEYLAAFPHYEAVIEGEPAPAQAGAALTRLAWMVYDGNGEVDLALTLFDRALDAAPGDPFAQYLKGRVLWCGRGDTAAATDLFQQVLTSGGLEGDVRSRVETDLAAVESGEDCE